MPIVVLIIVPILNIAQVYIKEILFIPAPDVSMMILAGKQWIVFI